MKPCSARSIAGMLIIMGAAFMVLNTSCSKPSNKQAVPAPQAAAPSVNNEDLNKKIGQMEARRKTDPSDPGIPVILCDLYSQKGDIGKSEQLVKQILEKNPKDPWTLRTVGSAYMRAGNEGKAEEYLTKASTADSGNNKNENAFAYFGLSHLYMKRGDTKRAAACVAKAHELCPDDRYITEEFNKLSK